MRASADQIARRAAESVLGGAAGAPQRLAAGRSCEAYVVAAADPGAREWVVRVPVAGTDRTVRLRAEASVGGLLAARGHPVASWRVIDVDGVPCAVGERLLGAPVRYGAQWSHELSAGLGALLSDLHALPTVGFGPLLDQTDRLRGESESVLDGVRRRWCWAPCWPYDGSDLADHPVSRLLPDATPAIARRVPQLLDAARGPIGLVHSDLHCEHILVGSTGALAGVLDFGDAFVGSRAWDFALLHWYYGSEVTAAVARHHADGPDLAEGGRILALAVGLYKVAKSPEDPSVPPRLARVLSQQ